MTLEMFRKCMLLVQRSENPTRNGGHKFVWLNHFGEPLLNPLLPDLIASARDHAVEVSFSSNGVDQDGKLFSRSTWRQLADAGLEQVDVSAHVKPVRVLVDHIGDIVKVAGIFRPTREYFHDWAGQVDMSRMKLDERPTPTAPCDYQLHNMFAITWDRRIAACCYDIEARTGVTVDDVLQNGFEFREISLCRNCRLGRGDASWIGCA